MSVRLAELKRDARAAAAAARRRAASAAAAEAADRAAQHLVAALAARPEPAVISGYLAIRDELDPMPAMQRLIALGRRVCVPVIAGKGLPLRFRAWTPGVPLVEGPFGVPVPQRGDWLTPEALIVPLLAFDRAGYRLGYGGGFYDRTLAALRAEGPVTAIGYAFAAQEIERVPVEATDAPLDAVATERGVTWFG